MLATQYTSEICFSGGADVEVRQ